MKTWRERIVDARERGSFLDHDMRDAQDFDTCAVGEQHGQLPGVVVYVSRPFLTTYRPKDETLHELGCRFYWKAVSKNNPDHAEVLLDQIEDRVLQLKREAGS